MNGARTHGALSGFVVFTAIAIFAAMVLLLAILGARNFRAVVEGSAENTLDRVYSFFVVNRLRAADGMGAVAIETDFGMDVIRIADKTGGSLYYTRIYCVDGALMESYLEEGVAFDPAMGEALCAARALTAREAGGLIEIAITGADGQTFESCFAGRG